MDNIANYGSDESSLDSGEYEPAGKKVRVVAGGAATPLSTGLVDSETINCVSLNTHCESKSEKLGLSPVSRAANNKAVFTGKLADMETVLSNKGLTTLSCVGGSTNDSHTENYILPGGDISIPKDVLTLYSGRNDPPRDSPSLHAGRIRSFKHVSGNWASYVYLPLRYDDTLVLAERLCRVLSSVGEFRVSGDFHMSISRTVTFRSHWIQAIGSSLRRLTTLNSRFSVTYDRVSVYNNDENTMTFVGATVSDYSAEKVGLLSEGVNRIFHSYKLRPFYVPASFHVTLCWCVGDLSRRLSSLSDLQETFDWCQTEYGCLENVLFDEVNMKSGHLVYSYPFLL